VSISVVKPAAIRAALRTYLAGCAASGEEPVDETYQFYRLLEKKLDVDFSVLRPWDARRSANLFTSQVLNALNSLAVEGLLVKRGDRNSLRFCTPEAAKRADERTQAEQAAAYRYTAHVQALSDRLQALGMDPLVDSGAPLRLDPEDWGVLVQLAERGRQFRNEDS
jgi:hypothetical protein